MVRKTLAWLLKAAQCQPETTERVHLSWISLRAFVEKDGDRDECLTQQS